MLDQHDFERHKGVNARPAIVFAIQAFNKFKDFVEVDCRVDLPQQMVGRHHFFQTYKFDLIPILNILRKHVYHSYFYTIFPVHREISREKATRALFWGGRRSQRQIPPGVVEADQDDDARQHQEQLVNGAAVDMLVDGPPADAADDPGDRGKKADTLV